jgi:hypothetical protein
VGLGGSLSAWPALFRGSPAADTQPRARPSKCITDARAATVRPGFGSRSSPNSTGSATTGRSLRSGISNGRRTCSAEGSGAETSTASRAISALTRRPSACVLVGTCSRGATRTLHYTVTVRTAAPCPATTTGLGPNHSDTSAAGLIGPGRPTLARRAPGWSVHFGDREANAGSVAGPKPRGRGRPRHYAPSRRVLQHRAFGRLVRYRDR